MKNHFSVPFQQNKKKFDEKMLISRQEKHFLKFCSELPEIIKTHNKHVSEGEIIIFHLEHLVCIFY